MHTRISVQWSVGLLQGLAIWRDPIKSTSFDATGAYLQLLEHYISKYDIEMGNRVGQHDHLVVTGLAC